MRFTGVVLLIVMGFLSACTGFVSDSSGLKNAELEKAVKVFHRLDDRTCRPLPFDAMTKKIDAFALIFDASASMTEPYMPSASCGSCHDRFADAAFASEHRQTHAAALQIDIKGRGDEQSCNACHYDYLFSKYHFARQLALCFNRTIPDLELQSGLKTFGNPAYSIMYPGPIAYEREDFDLQLRKILEADGVSPLDLAFKEFKKEWFPVQGKSAIVLLSDGCGMGDKDVYAAEELKRAYGDNLCIYTVAVGNDPEGHAVMERIARAGQCGYSLLGDTLLSSAAMDRFVRDIFLAPAPQAVAPRDSDGDGVIDGNDDCPGTDPGQQVDERGCPKIVILADVLFDFDKDVLKPAGMQLLDKAVSILQRQEGLLLHLSGHTDSMGSMEYNVGLSQRRARAARDYFLSKGIDAARITTSWHSFSEPVADNATTEGRAKNRRVEIRFSKGK